MRVLRLNCLYNDHFTFIYVNHPKNSSSGVLFGSGGSIQNQKKTPLSLTITGLKMEPAVRVELTTNGLQIQKFTFINHLFAVFYGFYYFFCYKEIHKETVRAIAKNLKK